MKNLGRWFLAILLLSISFAAFTADDDFLEFDRAFTFSARTLDAQTIEVRWKIADGYYMYRDRISFAADHAVALAAPQMPAGEVKYDDVFKKELETYRHELVVRMPVRAGVGDFTLTATSQGCADKGLCYPPTQQTAKLLLAAMSTPGQGGGLINSASGTSGPNTSAATAPLVPPTASSAPLSEDSKIEAALKSGSLLTVMPLFLVLGLLLSFTPCVLPMIPILSSIIVGQSSAGTRLSKSRGFSLALAYSLGMAIVYTALGVAAGLAGEGLAAALQRPAVLATFALLLVALALSMFGFYELQLPAGLQARLAGLSNNQKSGSYAGVFVMGAISALIVGPCVAAPLAGALLYISQTHDVVVGGGALFAMASGMSVPLLLVGLSAGSLLPRAGGWMEGVKKFFGVLLIAVAIWMVSPVLPAWTYMLAWAALFVVCASYLRVFDPLPEDVSGWRRLWKGIGAVLLVAGGVLIVGVATGGRDVLQPLQQLAAKPRAEGGMADTVTSTRSWRRVKTLAELDAAIANSGGRAAMLDFYADWCVSCAEMERFTFQENRVAARLDKMLLLQADVTRNSDDDKGLLKRFKLFGPPGIIFFNAAGQEVPGARVVGFQNADTFLASLDRAAATTTAAATANEANSGIAER